jgi:hypothetical protein
MVKSNPNPQERIARELLTQRPLFLGVDGEGTAHYWDGYERAAVVVPDDAATTDDADRFDLADTPLETLRGWAEHVRNKRGWETGPRICSSIVDQLADRLEAAQ